MGLFQRVGEDGDLCSLEGIESYWSQKNLRKAEPRTGVSLLHRNVYDLLVDPRTESNQLHCRCDEITIRYKGGDQQNFVIGGCEPSLVLFDKLCFGCMAI